MKGAFQLAFILAQSLTQSYTEEPQRHAEGL
jgi:hypothetical protein